MIFYESKSFDNSKLVAQDSVAPQKFSIPCNSLKTAKDVAQTDYCKYRPGERIIWKKLGPGRWSSGDLGFVSYVIEKRSVRV